MNVPGFWKTAETFPERIALITDEGDKITYGAMGRRVNQLSNALLNTGLRHGDHLSLLMGNDPEWLEIYMAALQIGLYFTPINFHLTATETTYIVDNSDAQLFIASADYATVAQQTASQLSLGANQLLSLGFIDGFTELKSFISHQSDSPPTPRQVGSQMLYTSGTTGHPKGVLRQIPEGPPELICNKSAHYAELYGLNTDSGVQLITGPLYHAAPCANAVNSLNYGHSVILMKKWDAERTLQLIEQHQVTDTHLVPIMFHRMLALPEPVKAQYDLSSLCFIMHGAAPCSASTKRKMIDWLGPILWEYYGATEGGGARISSQEWLQRPGSVGKPWTGSEIVALDENDQPCPPNTPGTLYMKSTLGDFEYYKSKEKTAACYKNGYLTVGDVGYLDDEGYLFLSDRKIDMIISGGVNIYPVEIEAVLVEHPSVADVAVIGIPDDEWGESVKAIIELNPSISASDQLTHEILALAKDQLAKFKHPKSIEYIDELPRLITGKLYKRLLRDKYWKNQTRSM